MSPSVTMSVASLPGLERADAVRDAEDARGLERHRLDRLLAREAEGDGRRGRCGRLRTFARRSMPSLKATRTPAFASRPGVAKLRVVGLVARAAGRSSDGSTMTGTPAFASSPAIRQASRAAARSTSRRFSSAAHASGARIWASALGHDDDGDPAVERRQRAPRASGSTSWRGTPGRAFGRSRLARTRARRAKTSFSFSTRLVAASSPAAGRRGARSGERSIVRDPASRR